MQRPESLVSFGAYIQRLIRKENLSREETYALFTEVLLGTQPELHQGAFLAALASKGETAHEIVGAWQAILELDTNTVEDTFDSPLVENSGTGMDRIKTFNVSTAAGIIAAAGGAKIARHGARALTSKCGTIDMLEALGVNVDCGVAEVAESIREAGIGVFNGMSDKVHPRALFRILSGIRFGTTLNIAASLASPCMATRALRGVYSDSVIPYVADVMRKIGYERGMVVHGFDGNRETGMDEISNLGETSVREFLPSGETKDYTLVPEDFGMKRTTYDTIAANGDLGFETNRFLNVLSGTGYSECCDLACLNAGAVLYVSGKAETLKVGVRNAEELVHSGKALEKLIHWVSIQSDREHKGLKRLADAAKDAGILERVRALL